MGVIRERMQRLTISSISPDESVKGTMSRASGITVEIERDSLEYHSEESLSHQITRVLSGLLEGHAKAVGIIEHEASEESGPVGNGRAAELRTTLDQTVEESVSACESGPEKYATVEWHGIADVKLSVRSGALSYLTPDDLSVEVNTAIANAARSRERQLVQIYTLMYRSDDRRART